MPVYLILKSRAREVEGPLMCIGDFNDILYHYEKEGGRVRDDRKLMGFRNLVEQSGFIDLGFNGQKFTWIGKKEVLIKERLDRAVVNIDWVGKFPRTQVFNLPIIGSDHAPIMVD